MRRRSLAVAAIGLGALGAGVAAQRRAVRRVRARPDDHADEPYGTLRGRSVEVVADDGVLLHAEIDDEERTDLAIVFSHGWTVNQDSWHYQRKALRGLGRLVFWDQRGHGYSDPTSRKGATVRQIGADLAAVLRATVPEGTPIVLVGHSMGGMTIMSYADLHPEEFGRSVRAAGLVCTSSGGLKDITLGMPRAVARSVRPVLDSSLRLGRAAAPLLERMRALGRDGSLLLGDYIAFGPHAAPSDVAFLERMIAEARVDAMLDFFHVLETTSSFGTLKALKDVRTLIIGAEHDILTPLGHSLAIAAAVPDSRLEVVPEVAHMAMLESHETVTAHLRTLVDDVRADLHGTPRP